ncbi:MAG: FAD:protein FMN transferase [Rhodobacteraceae bacterium]|nr:FAD:protein FMN transferase [Paracoccaceae bacterium]
MSTDLHAQTLTGPTMGTSWSAEIGAPASTNLAALEKALADAVALVDNQMSSWKPESDLMRLNAAPLGEWVNIPPELMQVLARGLEIGRLSGGAFDIGLGDLVTAWGFAGKTPSEADIRAKLGQPRPDTAKVLELDKASLRARKHAPLALDLSGIAKGYGVDRMMQVCDVFGLGSALVALDGEVRSKGVQPNGKPWAVAIEKPDYTAHTPLSMLELQDAAVATSGDYRHWVQVGQARLSHTMDRQKGGPVQPGIASVTVVAADCMTADAMATAILVQGLEKGAAFARDQRLDCLIMERKGEGIVQHGVGALFTLGEQAE